MNNANNLVDLVDHTFFLGERATGVTSVLQCVWVYDGAIDIDGLRRFHGRLARGRLSRRVERSPLPFGRHRWVAPGTHCDLEIAAPRPRDEFDAWLGEQAAGPLDPEHGPEWRLAVLAFTDGGAGVSLVTSHCLTDGVGLCEALAAASVGHDDATSWPAAGSRRRWKAVREDARQTARDMRAMRRALAATVGAARSARQTGSTAPVPAPSAAPPVGADERISLPMATIFFGADDWDARAQSLGGTSNSLLAGLAARLGQRAGRVNADGSVTLSMPVNERTPGDTRANAVAPVEIPVDPALAATDLRGIRSATKRALTRRAEFPDERLALLPLAPLIPEWLARRMVGVAAGGATNVVSSNLGAIDPAVNRPDGNEASRFAIKGYNLGVTRAVMHRTGGILTLVAGRLGQQVFVTVLAYQPGRSNSDDELRRILWSAADDFTLPATTGWPCAEPGRGGAVWVHVRRSPAGFRA
jgi:hypothetical protein